MKHYQPRILVSSCLEYKACRYDGSMIGDAFLKKLKDYVEIIHHCPEVEMGLSIPREAVRVTIIDGKKDLISSMSGENQTEKMTSTVNKIINNLKTEKLHGAILKNRSPSCGISTVKVYNGSGKRPPLDIKTNGFFGGALIDAFLDLPIEDEGRLLNYVIRDHFLTQIYTLSSFDEVKLSHKISELVAFQSKYKYLLMAYSQLGQKKLGHIVANHDGLSMDELLINYEALLKEVLNEPLDPGRNTNVISHIFGYFSDQLSSEEKHYFIEQVDLYRNKKLPFPALMTLLYGWVLRFDDKYLLSQKIFEPYPKEILDIADSGRGVK